MHRTLRPSAAVWLSIPLVFAVVVQSASAPQWEVHADCAAAYQANWQNRLSDPNRKPDMSSMIQEVSEQYKVSAIGLYLKEKRAAKDEASRSIESYIKTNIERFIAMDKVGTLEAYIDKCPQAEEAN